MSRAGRAPAACALGAALLAAAAAPATTHTLEHAVLADAPATVLALSYSDGGLPRFAAIRIFAPDDPQRPFQIGRTDDAGRFAFVATRPGAWRIELDDETEHKASFTVDVGADRATGGSMSLTQKLALGGSVMLNIGLLALWLDRRKAQA